jgi:predicted dehydrogenase
VEKPFVLNVEEGKEIKKILKNNNYYFMEGLMYRFHPQYKILKKLLNNKVIGNIIKIESSFGYKDNDAKKLPRLYDKKLGGGCIYDIGIYPISFSSFVNKILINKKNEIKIIKSKGIIKKNGVEVEAIGTFLLNNKLKLNLRCSFIKKLQNTCTLIGENGKIIIKDPWTPGKNGGYHETSIIVKKNLYEKIYLTKSNKHLFSYEIDYFYNKIFQNYNKNKFPYVSFDESFENLNFLNIWKKSL